MTTDTHSQTNTHTHTHTGTEARDAARDGASGTGARAEPAVAELNALVVATAPWAFQSLYVAAKLGLADLLADGSRSSDQLAESAGADPDALYRFCRALAGLGVFRELPDRVFALTATGAALRSDAPGGLRYFIIVNGEESFRAWADVMHSVRTGRPAFDHVFGMSHFDFLARERASSTAFNTMAGRGPAIEAVEGFDFSGDRVVVDVGGGMGGLLAHVLRGHPHLRGILLDTPAGVAEAPELLRRHGVADRTEVVGGSFFDAVPAGGDTYLLARVIHDWGDGDALKILARVREAMRPGARLLVIDKVIPAVDGFHPGKFADLQMLVVLGGRERTMDELTALLARGGFAVTGARFPEPDSHGGGAEATIEAHPAHERVREPSP
jgi:hypothetical protein